MALSLGVAALAIAQELSKPAWNGRVLGFIPYDFRPPSLERIRASLWNPEDPHVLTSQLLAGMGARVFAQRARGELLATGEHARRRVVETNHELTWQEHQVAFMARDGYSNQDIGSRLFISPKTVEYHLHKAFSKLAITSRYQLEHVLPSSGSGHFGRTWT
jgi:DNA-binding NarL/FixJ family response regulator